METQKEMAEVAKQRPGNFEKLTPQEQWEVDKKLGILDWDGNDTDHEEEYRQSFKRAFEGQNLEETYIRIDGFDFRDSEFLRKSWEYGNRKEWLRVEIVELEQETFYKGYLTEKGKREVLS